jgi:hypothetical protein
MSMNRAMIVDSQHVLCLLALRWLLPLPDLCRPKFRRCFSMVSRSLPQARLA